MKRVRNGCFVFMLLTAILNPTAAGGFSWQAVFNDCIQQGGSITNYPVPDNRCGLRFEFANCNVSSTIWDACADVCDSSTPVSTVPSSVGSDWCECDVCIQR